MLVYRSVVKLETFPKVRGENKQIFELPPPRYVFQAVLVDVYKDSVATFVATPRSNHQMPIRPVAAL